MDFISGKTLSGGGHPLADVFGESRETAVPLTHPLSVIAQGAIDDLTHVVGLWVDQTMPARAVQDLTAILATKRYAMDHAGGAPEDILDNL